MRLLLDTQALILLLEGGSGLSPDARRAITDPAAVGIVSAASVWEIAIKSAAGKLTAPADLLELLPGFRVEVRAITAEVAYATRDLPLHHRDTFDRLIIAQAKAEGLPVVSGDPVFAHYGVAVIW